MRSTSGLLAVALLHGAAAVSIGPVGNLPITNAVVSPDGFSRSAILAGGSFPGPLINARPHSAFSLTVQDQLSDTSMMTATSVHWHGLFQKNTTFSDGVAFVSQCPITPGNQFTYNFNSNGQFGTYWYHSHYSTQYCDGLRGPLVIYHPNDPYLSLYDIDNELTVITLADWYHVPSPKHGNLDYPDSTLINGLGRTWANTTNTTLAVQAVQKGLRYRLRIVSLSCEPAYTFSIDGHNLTVIEADGILHQPYLVDSVTVYPGQRYSAILHANQRAGNYWIRALPVDDGLFFPNGAFTGGINSAILRYNGAPAAEPTTQSSAGSNELVEANMTPRVVTPAPGTPDVNAPDVFKLNMAYTLNFSDFQFEMNGNETHLPSVPTLLQIMSGAQKAQDALAPGQYISIPANSVVQLSFPGADPAPTTRHSIHLHGHPFAVIRSAGQADYNFVNPPWRDVVSMGGPGDNVTIRFQTDNSGPWFLHCHVDWHLAAGFFATFVEDTPSNIAAYNKPSDPNAMNDLCEAWDSFSAGGGQ